MMECQHKWMLYNIGFGQCCRVVLSEASHGSCKIKYFSHRQSIHWFETGLKGVAFFLMDQCRWVMRSTSMPFALSSPICEARVVPSPLLQSDMCWSHLFSRESDSTIANVCPSVHPFVCHKSKPFNSLKSSSFIILHSYFIILHSSFLHFATFKLFSLFRFIKY